MSLDPTTVQMIRQLAAGDWVSGTTLAQRLQISREAVSKRMHKLADLQLHVDKQAGRGYRLSPALQLLDAAQLGAQLSGLLEPDQLVVPPSTESTNLWLTQHPHCLLYTSPSPRDS